ncbi:hypothetical protein N7522_001732 [Penicillium canescens]|nr:hypothetical protein N7522_001732 [Penicillium canescens]
MDSQDQDHNNGGCSPLSVKQEPGEPENAAPKAGKLHCPKPNPALLETIEANKYRPESRPGNLEQEMPSEQQEEKPHDKQSSLNTQDETPGFDLSGTQNMGDNGVSNKNGNGEEDEEDWETDNGQDSGEDDKQNRETDTSESAPKDCNGSKDKEEMPTPNEEQTSKPDEEETSKLDEGKSSKPGEEQTVMPDEDEGSMPDEDEGSMPDEDEGSMPDEDDGSMPGEDDGSKHIQSYSNVVPSSEEPSHDDRARFDLAKQQEAARISQIEEQRLLDEDLQLEKELKELDHLLEIDSEMELQEVSTDDEPQERAPKKPSSKPKPKPKQATKAQISKEELTRASDIGLRHLLDTREEQQSKNSSAKKGIKRLLQHATKRSTKRRQGANVNASMAELPGSDKKDKSKALAEIIASLPVSDQEKAKSDMKQCIEASKRFKPAAKLVGKAWKIKGLETHLYHYQLLTVAWMRDRENSAAAPKGGLLCDEMGLGKTLTAIANFVEGRSATNSEGPTLIVVPRNLVTHWLNQLTTHCEGKSVNPVAYHAGSRMRAGNLGAWFQDQDIVVTTYYEICNSYPTMKPPEGLKTPEGIQEWWQQFYAEHLGAFHEITWHRIILDEAHVIKNPKSKTSIAVRALSASYKWVLTGTPLHNCIEEFYPYFEFIGVPASVPYNTFEQNYCNGSQLSHDRLIAMLRLVLHRKTHDSRMFKLPLIHLPGIAQQEKLLEPNPAETYLYERMHQFFINMLNGLVSDKGKQFKCFLTMILKLRMFTSHILAAQDIVKRVIDQAGVIQKLKHLVNGQGNSPSANTIKLLIAMKSKVSLPWESAPTRVEDSFDRPRPPASNINLREKLRAELDILHQRKRWNERLQHSECPRCGSPPVESVVLTACLHLYCEQCFDELPDEDGNIDTVSRLCRICQVPITEANFYKDLSDPVELPKQQSTAQSPEASFMKRKKSTPKKTAKGKTKRQRKSPKVDKRPSNLHILDGISDEESDDSSEDEMDLKSDWIPHIGYQMPSTKLDAIKDLVDKWVKEDKKVKIVIFTQFLASVTLIEYLCQTNGWGHTKMSGKMSFSSREDQVKDFRDDEDIHVLISSLRTGGVGLDLSMANKCIMVDLWWNEAAYCRLYRIGQVREVEYVKLITKGTIDELLFDIQRGKTKKINTVMSQKALTGTNSMMELLSMFGQVTETPGGAFRISAFNPEEKARFWEPIRKRNDTT